VALLAVLVLACTLVVGRGLFTVDEGAYLAAARWVDEEGRWLHPYLVPDLVEGPEPAPLALSAETDQGWGPYVRAPAFVWALVAARQVHPTWGPVALPGVGLVALATLVALVARRTRPGAERLAFWAVGAASPYLVHAQIVWAHTLLGAAAGAALLGLVALTAAGARRAGPFALAVAGSAAAVLLRSEGRLLVAALGAALALEAVRARRPRAGVAAGAAGLGLVIGLAANTALVGHALGSPGGLVTHRFDPDPLDALHAAARTVLSPGEPVGPLTLARAVAVVLLGWAAARSAAGAPDRGPTRLLAVAGLAAGLAGTLEPTTYGGLLPAAPLLVAGGAMALAARPLAWPPWPAVAAALFVASVVALSPPDGGGLGWGGRYVLPAVVLVAVPVAGAVHHQVGVRRDRTALVVVGAAALVTLGVQVNALRTVHVHHTGSREAAPLVAADLEAAAAHHRILVTTDIRIGRLAPDVARRVPLVSIPQARLDEVLAGSRRLGLEPPLLLALGRPPTPGPGWRVARTEDLRVLTVVWLEADGP
jgi:hypothetical protein